MGAIACLSNRTLECLPWALAESRMIQRVVHLVGVLGQHLLELAKRPRRVGPGIDRLRHQARRASGLSVAQQVVKQLLVGCAKEAFARGAEPRLRRRPRFLGDLAASQQRFEIDAVEFLAAVHHQDLREPLIPAHTLAQGHHG